ncbi:MAG: hypothetical protein EPN64_00075 [Burkholderiaceae bacterium]|nr:MAG: hypothetical protein EPN64_00075 [Burkholderiaceae bacterium]
MKKIIGLDIGYGNTKAVWSASDTGNPDSRAEVCFPSVLAPCHNPALAKMDGMGSRDRTVVEIDGKSYFVGREASVADTLRILDPEFIHRPEYRAFMAGAFHYYFKATGSVVQSIDMLVLGLPVSAFQGKRGDLKAIGSRVHRVPVPKALQRLAERDTVDFVAKKVLVVPQPFGALRLAMEKQIAGGGDLPDDGLTLVIDPGFCTLDWFLAEGMAPQFELCGSFNGGVSQILREVAHSAGLTLGTGDLNLVAVERALASGVLKLGGRSVDFSPYQAIARSVAMNVVDEFLLNFNFLKIGVSRIVLAGGGAAHYVDALRQRLPDFEISAAADSVMDNARGFYLIGKDAMGGEVGD